jgi:hypothetical protein
MCLKTVGVFDALAPMIQQISKEPTKKNQQERLKKLKGQFG